MKTYSKEQIKKALEIWHKGAKEDNFTAEELVETIKEDSEKYAEITINHFIDILDNLPK
jgi:hypothetical protein